MIFQQLNRSDAERIDLVVGNVDGGGSLTTGLGVALVEAGASIDGISATRHTAGQAKGFIGIAVENIPINGYGLVRAHGIAAAYISNVGTSITITRGDVLIPSAIAGQFFSSVTPQGMSTLLYKYAYAAETTVAVSALGTIKAVVRAL